MDVTYAVQSLETVQLPHGKSLRRRECGGPYRCNAAEASTQKKTTENNLEESEGFYQEGLHIFTKKIYTLCFLKYDAYDNSEVSLEYL